MAEKRVDFASTKKVDEFPEEVSELLRFFASVLKEPEDTEEEWLSYAFVSDESRLADFFYQDCELTQLEKLSGIDNLKMRDLICDVACTLHQTKQM
jgi:hypothetical protein